MALAVGKRVGVLCGMWRAFVRGKHMVDREQAQWVEVVVLEDVDEDDASCELGGCACEGSGGGDMLMEQLDEFLCLARSLPACFI